MTRLIPNENTYLGFAAAMENIKQPTQAEIEAAVDLTGPLIAVNASSQGNTVPTPSLRTLFETSIPGTVQAAFTADFYRDDETELDIAWITLPRRSKGFMVLSRFGGSHATIPGVPITGDTVEVWPVLVVSRTMANAGSNTALTFTCTCSVYEEPSENSIIAA